MAKPKNAPALFEVIRRAQEKQRKEEERQQQLQTQRELAGTADGQDEHLATSLLRSPLFWFKGRQALVDHATSQSSEPMPVTRAVPAAPAAPAYASRGGKIDIAEEARRMREEIAASRPADDLPEPEAVVAASVAVAEPPQEIQHESYDDVPRSFFDAPPEPAAAPSHAAEPFDLDRALSEGASTSRLAVPLSYTTGIVAGCGVLLLCGVVYLATSLGSGPQTALADSKPNPAVLDVKPAAPVDQSGPLARPEPKAAESTSVENLKPIAPPKNVKRIYSQQYIVLLSSPIAKDAQEAVKFLADNGIPATAEQALPGYSRSWYSVITTKGFERTRDNPEFDAYVAQLAKLMQKYAKGSKFKQSFRPDVYTWRTK